MSNVATVLRNSRLRAALSTGIIGGSYRRLVSGGTNNRLRIGRPTREIPPSPFIPNTTAKIVLPRGTVLFRATTGPINTNSNVTRCKFHYFHPLPGLGVVGRSHLYKRFYMFALKYDTVFYLLVSPGNRNKRWITAGASNNIVNKIRCRRDGVQGYIALDPHDTNPTNPAGHSHLVSRYRHLLGTNVNRIQTNNMKFVHRNTAGRTGFPECVMWYEDLDYNNTSNRNKKLMVEPIISLHMPNNVTEQQRVQYIANFYRQVLGIHLKMKTHVRTSLGEIPFAHYIFPNMETENKARNYLRQTRRNFNNNA